MLQAHYIIRGPQEDEIPIGQWQLIKCQWEPAMNLPIKYVKVIKRKNKYAIDMLWEGT